MCAPGARHPGRERRDGGFSRNAPQHESRIGEDLRGHARHSHADSGAKPDGDWGVLTPLGRPKIASTSPRRCRIVLVMLNPRDSLRSRRNKLWLSCACAWLATGFVVSAAAQQPATAPIVLHAARLLEVDTGNVLRPCEILVEGERIKAVGTTVDHPQGARIIDLG